MPTTKEQKADGWVSVTEVLDYFIPKQLLDWYLKTGKTEAKRLSNTALKIGSRVDELICEDVKLNKYKLTAKDHIEVRNCMEAWESFKRDYGFEVKACQVEVKSHSEKLVGHIDLIMDNMVVDVKCSSSIKNNYWLQVAKYAEMYREELLGLAILRLDKNLGTYQFIKSHQADKHPSILVDVYNGLLSAYRYYNAPKEQGEQ